MAPQRSIDNPDLLKAPKTSSFIHRSIFSPTSTFWTTPQVPCTAIESAPAAMIKSLGGRKAQDKSKQKIPISPALAELLDELDGSGENSRATKVQTLCSLGTVNPLMGMRSGRLSTLPRKERASKIFGLRFSTLRRHSLDFGGHSRRAAKDCCRTQAPRHSREIHQRA